MRNDEIDELARTRAVPLPEEAAKESTDANRRAEAETVLGDSENRIAEAAATPRPADAADEHRRSEDTA